MNDFKTASSVGIDSSDLHMSRCYCPSRQVAHTHLCLRNIVAYLPGHQYVWSAVRDSSVPVLLLCASARCRRFLLSQIELSEIHSGLSFAWRCCALWSHESRRFARQRLLDRYRTSADRASSFRPFYHVSHVKAWIAWCARCRDCHSSLGSLRHLAPSEVGL